MIDYTVMNSCPDSILDEDSKAKLCLSNAWKAGARNMFDGLMRCGYIDKRYVECNGNVMEEIKILLGE